MYASHRDTNAVTIASDILKDVWKGIEGINTSQPTHGPPSSDYGFNTLGSNWHTTVIKETLDRCHLAWRKRKWRDQDKASVDHIGNREEEEFDKKDQWQRSTHKGTTQTQENRRSRSYATVQITQPEIVAMHTSTRIVSNSLHQWSRVLVHQVHAHGAHREREDDRRLLLCSDGVQRLQVT